LPAETNIYPPMPLTTTISIVEDDAGLRGELELLVNAAAGFGHLRSYPDAETALAAISGELPDLLLMDINLPGMSGIDCVRLLKTRHPDLPIVMLTVYEDSDALFKSLMAGANGYLVKRTPRPKLIEALREICAGGAPMSRSIARKVVEFFHQVNRLPAPAKQAAELEQLTPREQEILASLAKGHSYKEIATDCGISGDTVRKHMVRIYEKLHVHSRTEAILKFLGK
jgi:DNA-binding NarL/FixJ family response regulator